MQEITQLKGKQFNFSLPFADDKVELRDLIYILLEGKWIILGITFFLLMIGSYFAFSKPSLYQANVLIQVENKEANSNLLTPILNFGKGTIRADIQIALIKSRFILTPVVESLGLDISIKPHYFPLIGSFIPRIFNLNKYVIRGESILIDRFWVPNESQNTDYKIVTGKEQTYKLYDPNGKFLLEGKAGKLIELKNNNVTQLLIFVKSIQGKPGTEFFLTKLSADNIADKYAQQIEILDLGQAYQNDKTGVLQMSLIGGNPYAIVSFLNAVAEKAVQKDIDRKSVEAGKTLSFLEKQLPLIKESLITAEINLNKQRTKNGNHINVAKTQVIMKQLSDLQLEMTRLLSEQVILNEKFTSAHPFVIQLKAKKSALEKEIITVEKKFKDLPQMDHLSLGLIRDIKVKNQLYLYMLHKVQELEIAKAGTISDVRILKPAAIPNSELPSGKILTIITSLLLGMIFGSIFVFFRKTFHKYVDDPNWVEEHYGIPTFAIVPYSNEQKINMQNYKDKYKKNLKLLAESQPRDLSIESLRSLRTSLQFALLGAKNNIITIMGISPGIGKSFISANFTYILGEAGKRVLLIDGDIRKGYLHDYFDKARTPGLSEAITGQVKLSEVIQNTPIKQVDFIATGKFPPNPSELLLSENFEIILSELSQKYDLIIIDTAPILAVTDGTIIGNLAGVNFLVVAWGKHQAEEINLAMKRLQNNGVKVQGVIVNSTMVRTPIQGRYNYNYAYGE